MSHAGTPLLNGIGSIIERYAALLVDSYGVLHDGATPFPGAIECLLALREGGRRIVILTNTPRRAATVAGEIARVGVHEGCYDHLVSAGELAFRALRSPAPDLEVQPGSSFFYVGPERSREILAGLPFVEAGSPASAGFLLVTGLYPDRQLIDDYEPILREARRRGLPCVCANPDRLAIRAGVPGLAAGAIASRYAELGGRVRNFGKPFPEIYRMALTLLGDIGPDRVLAVGDALYTDIAGASGAGLDSAFIVSGIHGAEIGWPAEPDVERLDALFAREGIRPTLALPTFRYE